jgi:hypothetical protein
MEYENNGFRFSKKIRSLSYFCLHSIRTEVVRFVTSNRKKFGDLFSIEEEMNIFKSLTVGAKFQGAKNKDLLDLFSGKKNETVFNSLLTLYWKGNRVLKRNKYFRLTMTIQRQVPFDFLLLVL